MIEKFRSILFTRYLGYICLIVFFPVNSQISNVSTSEELVEAVNNGQPGDTIQISEGTYILNSSLEPKEGMTIRGMGLERTTIKGAAGWQPSIDDLPKTETPSSYLINLGKDNQHITIADLSLKGPQLHGAIYGNKCNGLHIYNLHIENFLWSSIRTFSMQDGRIHDNTFVNAGGKVGWTGGALFLSWSVDCEFWNNHILKTDENKKFFGFKGEKGTRCRFHHNTVQVNFSFEYPFLSDAYVEIDHNYFTGVISIPKFGGGNVPEGGFTFHIHHNYLTHSYAIEGTRNGAILDHNLFDFDTNNDGGNLITNFGTEPADGPTYFHENLIKNPGRGIFSSNAQYDNFHFYNNHVIANKTITPRNEGLFGFNEGNDFSTVVIKDNVIECINNPRPLMRNSASYSALIENNELINLSDSASIDNLQTGNPRGVPLDSIDFYCGAYEQFHVSGWDIDITNIEKDSFDVELFAAPPEGGIVERNGFFKKGERISVHAIPENGYFFEKWSANNEAISNEEYYSFNVTHDVDLIAHFLKGSKVTLNNYPENAGGLSGDGFFKVGSLSPISANPENGFRFEKWTETDTVYSFNPDTVVLVTSFERNLTAHYKRIYNLILSEDPLESGIVEGSGIYDEGDTIKITTEPNFGFAFSRWSEADTVYAFSSDTLIVISGDRTLTSNFSSVYSVQLYAEPTEGGVVNGGGVFLQGRETTMSAIPNEGYAFDIWTETDILNSLNSYFSSESDTTINVTRNRIFTARFYPVNAINTSSNVLLDVYPNPVYNVLFANVSSQKSHSSFIYIRDFLGKEILMKKLTHNDNDVLRIDLSALQPGIYFITFQSKDGIATRKIIKM